MNRDKHLERMEVVRHPVPDTQKTISPEAQPKLPVRQGVSQYVLETAKRLKKEYQADLDYLEKH